MPSKKSLLVGAAVATVTLGGVGSAGLVSAATSTNSTSSTSIVDKIASKFNLNKTEVQQLFDEDRSAKQAEHKAEQAEKIATAVKDGKLTQAQADYITKATAEIDALRGNTKPSDEDSTTRDQVRTKMEALRDWAQDNNIDMTLIGHGGHGGPGGQRGNRPADS